MSTATATQLVPLKEIRFPFSESGWFQRRHPHGHTVKTWCDADILLMHIAFNFGPVPGGYDKTDFEVEWEDGTQYGGRVDIHHHREPQESRHGLISLRQHIEDHCEFHTGRWTPRWMLDRYGPGKSAEIASRYIDDERRAFYVRVLDELSLKD